jgi:hypothetical protein
MMMCGPGSWMLLFEVLRFSQQMRYIASPPRWIASELPVVTAPSELCERGAYQRFASMEARR